jgi:two-component system, chemotaxis family, chemotaxis protein CheY
MMPLDNLRILVVDDDPKMRYLVDLILRGFGVTDLRAVGNGFEAFRLLQEWPADLLLVDYVMDGLDGISFTRLVREKFTGKRKPAIVIMTGFAELWRLDEAKKAGADDFLVKPFNAQALIARIRRAVSRREAGLPSEPQQVG